MDKPKNLKYIEVSVDITAYFRSSLGFSLQSMVGHVSFIKNKVKLNSVRYEMFKDWISQETLNALR